MNKIKKVSTYLLSTFNILLVLLPVLVVIQWLFIESSAMQALLAQGVIQNPVLTPEGAVYLNSVKWSAFSKAIGLSANAMGLFPIFLSLFALKSIFQNYQRSEIFSVANAGHYRYLGGLFFLDAIIAKPLGDMLMVLAVTFSNAPGHRYLSVNFGWPNLEALFCGILVIVISWVMLEASKLHDEQRFTI